MWSGVIDAGLFETHLVTDDKKGLSFLHSQSQYSWGGTQQSSK
jgi:hypothetical protein